MKHADEAKVLSQQGLLRKQEALFNSLEGLINKAIEDGCFEIRVMARFSATDMKRLNDLGYAVIDYGHASTISWGIPQ